jgi:hypothetical protein
VGWGIIGLIVAIGLSIALSLYYFAPPAARRLSLFFFLPISFWLARSHLPDIDSIFDSKVVFLAFERRSRRKLLFVPKTAKTGR